MNIISKSKNLSSHLKATAQAVSVSLKPTAAPVALTSQPVLETPAPAISSLKLSQCVPKGAISVVSGIGVKTQVRFVHTDYPAPDFSEYRRPSTNDPNRRNDTHEKRTGFHYLITGGTVAGAVYGTKGLVTTFIESMGATADVLALAKIEVNLNDIPEGKSVTFKWRGKPLFIRHRTATEIDTERKVPLSELRDPQQDDERTQQPEWLIVIGVCTHLGCVPIPNSGDFGGYYCPCHGSHYDASGRIRKGPAPLNLEVPPYDFQPGNLLVVG